jgi:hypothetical protein
LWKHYEDRKGLEDLGGGLPLCPRNEKTSSWTYRKTIDSMKIAKQIAGSFPRRGKSRTGPCGGIDPLQSEKKKEKQNKTTTATTLNELTELYRVSLGTSARKEGEVVVVGTAGGGEGNNRKNQGK